MIETIGIRRETKDVSQSRAPLSPAQVQDLIRKHNLRVIVEPWSNRIFDDQAYVEAGATLSSDLTACNIIFGIKEVYPEHQLRDKVYAFFSHTAKGQSYNMPMARALMANRISLFDYELVRNQQGQRLILFGDYAGYAGMIDSFWALGQRLRSEGLQNPFQEVQYATAYAGLEEARDQLRSIGNDIREKGLPAPLVPFITGFTGYGNVSKAAQSLYDLLPSRTIEARNLKSFMEAGQFDNRVLYKVEFRKDDLYRHNQGQPFDAEQFGRQPELYEEHFSRFLPYLTMLINGIYWEPRFPKIVTREAVRTLFKQASQPRLRVIGDITCDIEGSVEITVKATQATNPVFVFLAEEQRAVDGVDGRGPVVLAVDKLPTELPRESSESFGSALMPFVPRLARTRFDQAFEHLDLAAEWRGAMIMHHGELTPSYEYLRQLIGVK